MQRVLILGAGGHAQVVADSLLRAHAAGEAVCPIGYLDDRSHLHGHTLLGLPVLGSLADIDDVPRDASVVAIGDNATRQRVFTSLQQRGERFVVVRHPHAIVAPDVHLAPGTMISAGVIVNPGSTIGANVILNTGCTVDHHNQIADHVHIAPGVHTGGDVSVGEGTLLGIGATIMPQRRVGAWSVVGAGAVVVRDIADHTIVMGVPAHVVGQTQTKAH